MYATNVPLSKLLLEEMTPVFMASFLYLGAGLGMGALYLCQGWRTVMVEKNLAKSDLPATIGMIVLDILAPIFLMIGLQTAASANVSLLGNFEIVATTVIALVIFGEMVSARLWWAIGWITLSSILLTLEDVSQFNISVGSVAVMLVGTALVVADTFAWQQTIPGLVAQRVRKILKTDC